MVPFLYHLGLADPPKGIVKGRVLGLFGNLFNAKVLQFFPPSGRVGVEVGIVVVEDFGLCDFCVES